MSLISIRTLGYAVLKLLLESSNMFKLFHSTAMRVRQISESKRELHQGCRDSYPPPRSEQFPFPRNSISKARPSEGTLSLTTENGPCQRGRHCRRHRRRRPTK
jgi:hypothetical protein